jgi:hypothetical protein
MTITPALVNLTADAVIQAYNDYGGIAVTSPAGYSWTGVSYQGWEGLDPQSPATAKKFALVFRGLADSTQFLVAFRGTDTFDEWIADGLFPTTIFPGAAGVEVASGFLDVYTRALGGANPPSLQSSLTTYLKSVKVTQLIVTGHSLGSSLAALFAFDGAKNLGIKPTLITYASPNVGKASWAAAFNAAVTDAVRIFNYRDLVPYLPPTNMGYVSVGTDWPVKFDPQSLAREASFQARITNHSMDNYQYVAGHAVANTPPTWTGTFPDQSGRTSWDMESLDPATTTSTPLGKTIADAHLQVLQTMRNLLKL